MGATDGECSGQPLARLFAEALTDKGLHYKQQQEGEVWRSGESPTRDNTRLAIESSSACSQ